MRSDRLSLALSEGVVGLPSEGSLLVYRPRLGDDLSALPRERVVVVTGFKPDAEAFAAQGYRVEMEAPEGPHAAAIVCLPRARDLARAMLADASARVVPGGLIVVDGQKTDGIESALKELRGRGTETSPALSKAHGKLFTFAAGIELSDWAPRETEIEGGFITRPGVFSADAIDRGSKLLAAALPPKLHSRVADLGAGWGWLSAEILKRPGVEELHLIEAEAESLICAKRNITDPRAQFHWADVRNFKPAVPFGAVVCNPPFHTGRDADPSLGMAFLRAAAQMLTSSGTLWLVANRQLPYEPVLQQLFKEVEVIGGDSVFRLTRASRPMQARP